MLSLLHILQPSMAMLSVEASVSCCSGLIEMVYNVPMFSRQGDFSPSRCPFFTTWFQLFEHLLHLSSEALGDIKNWLHDPMNTALPFCCWWILLSTLIYYTKLKKFKKKNAWRFDFHWNRWSKNLIFSSNDCCFWSVGVRSARWRFFAKYHQPLKRNMEWCCSPRGKVPRMYSLILL